MIYSVNWFMLSLRSVVILHSFSCVFYYRKAWGIQNNLKNSGLYLFSSCEGLPCRRKSHKMIITSDHRGFAEVQIPTALPAPASIPSPELTQCFWKNKKNSWCSPKLVNRLLLSQLTIHLILLSVSQLDLVLFRTAGRFLHDHYSNQHMPNYHQGILLFCIPLRAFLFSP